MSDSKYDIKEAYELYQSGMSINKIARMYGIYNSVLYRAFERDGYHIEKSRKNQPNAKITDQELIDACKELKVIKHVSDKLGVSETTIRARLKRLSMHISDFK